MTQTKTITDFRSPWQRHQDACHTEVSHVSFDGHSVFEECSTCQLCWLLPDVLNRNKYPITIYKYPMEKHQ